ncbi:MAG: cytochrome c biogenesis protein CcdA [Candidatus Omnitrophota bacterium]
MENIAQYFNNISWLTYVIVFIGGLAASFTPCVFPLIPLLIGVLGSARHLSRGRSFILAFSYVLGMAVTYAILGMAAALTGKIFGRIQSSPPAQLLVGNVIILFGLALLDVIPLPVFLLNKAGAGKVSKTTSIPGVLVMGMASGLAAAPCVAAVSGALLTYVAASQNVILGFTLLFTFAVGLGAVLLLVGTFTGMLTGLPRLQKWMPVFQKFLALAMILLGEYYIFKAGMLSV